MSGDKKMCLNEQEKLLEIFDKKIESWKLAWCTCCDGHSVEGMSIYSSLIVTLIVLKRDAGLISESRYTNELDKFNQFKTTFWLDAFKAQQIWFLRDTV